MTVVVFTGPTISAEEARRHLDAVYLPPASAGDLYRAARKRPFAIGLIDGVFDRVPAVFHKEILWALREGIHVLGASSMGALRAAELRPFGMIGVGRVYDAFRSSVLIDDDEVAVAHLDTASGHSPRSEAMVNIRATVSAAERAGILDAGTAEAVLGAGKRLFYPDRSYAAVLSALAAEDVDQERVAAFAAWLRTHGPVNQKRDDAVELLVTLRALAESGVGPAEVAWEFSHTGYWQNFKDECDEGRDRTVERSEASVEQVLDELRLDPCLPAVWSAAVSQLLARSEAERRGFAFDRAGLAAAADELWAVQDVTGDEGLDRWMRERGVGRSRLNDLLTADAYRRWGERNVRYDLVEAVLCQLQLSIHYPRLLQRAETKGRVLTQRGLAGVDDPVGMDDEGLWRWWFRRCGRARPRDLDAYAISLGFGDDTSLRRAVVAEYHFISPPRVDQPRPVPTMPTRSVPGTKVTGLQDADVRAYSGRQDRPDLGRRNEVSASAIRALVRRVALQRGVRRPEAGRVTGLRDGDIVAGPRDPLSR